MRTFLKIFSAYVVKCKTTVNYDSILLGHNALSLGNQSLCLEGTQCLHLQGLRVLRI